MSRIFNFYLVLCGHNWFSRAETLDNFTRGNVEVCPSFCSFFFCPYSGEVVKFGYSEINKREIKIFNFE